MVHGVLPRMQGTTMTAIYIMDEARRHGYDNIQLVRKWPEEIGTISAAQVS